jgi:hypothetical protein
MLLDETALDKPTYVVPVSLNRVDAQEIRERDYSEKILGCLSSQPNHDQHDLLVNNEEQNRQSRTRGARNVKEFYWPLE